MQIGSSRLLEQAGGATRMSGVICALIMGTTALAGFDLPGLIPIPIVAGLVFYLGYTFIVDAFWRPFAQHAWCDLSLAVGVMVVCVLYGYLTGILVGIIYACVLFAISYVRAGIVRRHLMQTQFASNVDRCLVGRHPSRKMVHRDHGGDISDLDRRDGLGVGLKHLSVRPCRVRRRSWARLSSWTLRLLPGIPGL